MPSAPADAEPPGGTRRDRPCLLLAPPLPLRKGKTPPQDPQVWQRAPDRQQVGVGGGEQLRSCSSQQGEGAGLGLRPPALSCWQWKVATGAGPRESGGGSEEVDSQCSRKSQFPESRNGWP